MIVMQVQLHFHDNHKILVYNYNISVSRLCQVFSAFDESLIMSAILRLNRPAPIFHSPNQLISIQTSPDNVKKNIKNKWAHEACSEL